jgi:histidine triad (HIT) family protein
MSTIFKKIIDGEIPCYKVAENDQFLAFLDIQPLVKGHVLVIPKFDEDYIFDLEDDILSGLICFSKQVAKKMKLHLPCKKIGISVIGLEVAHAHIHLIPINSINDMNFSNVKLTLDPSEMKELADKILMS